MKIISTTLETYLVNIQENPHPLRDEPRFIMHKETKTRNAQAALPTQGAPSAWQPMTDEIP
jgi:hypothetical protein